MYIFYFLQILIGKLMMKKRNAFLMVSTCLYDWLVWNMGWVAELRVRGETPAELAPK